MSGALPKDFDASKLIKPGSDQPPQEPDLDEEDLDDGEGDPEGGADERADEGDGGDGGAGDERADEGEPDGEEFDDLTFDQLDERLKASVQSAIDDYNKKHAEAAADEGLDEKDRQIAKLTKERDEARKEAENVAQEAAVKAVTMEVVACVKKFAMTRSEVDRVVLYYQKNPDLEGVVPFEEAALRVMPALEGRTRTAPAGGNGRGERNGSKVITRGASGAPPAKPPKFQTGRGMYGDVTAYLQRTHAMNLIRVR